MHPQAAVLRCDVVGQHMAVRVVAAVLPRGKAIGASSNSLSTRRCQAKAALMPARPLSTLTV